MKRISCSSSFLFPETRGHSPLGAGAWALLLALLIMQAGAPLVALSQTAAESDLSLSTISTQCGKVFYRTVEGRVELANPSFQVLKVGKTLVRCSAKTEFSDETGAGANSFEAISLGDCVKATGVLHLDGSLRATSVTRIQCPDVVRPTPTVERTPRPTPVPPELMFINGRITRIGHWFHLLWVDQRLVHVSCETRILDEEGNPIRLKELRRNDCVTVYYYKGYWCALRAVKIVKGSCSQEPTPIPTTEPSFSPTPTVTPYVTETPVETPEPTVEPTEEPTPEPTAVPTEVPTPEPTPVPTAEPTAEPTPEPTAEPTPEPTVEPTPEPTVEPTEEPTPVPSPEPTVVPTEEPTPVPSPTSGQICGIKVEGVIGSIDVENRSFVVEGNLVVVSANTILLSADGQSLAFEDFAAGETIASEGCGLPGLGIIFAQTIQKVEAPSEPQAKK